MQFCKVDLSHKSQFLDLIHKPERRNKCSREKILYSWSCHFKMLYALVYRISMEKQWTENHLWLIEHSKIGFSRKRNQDLWWEGMCRNLEGVKIKVQFIDRNTFKETDLHYKKKIKDSPVFQFWICFVCLLAGLLNCK